MMDEIEFEADKRRGGSDRVLFFGKLLQTSRNKGANLIATMPDPTDLDLRILKRGNLVFEVLRKGVAEVRRIRYNPVNNTIIKKLWIKHYYWSNLEHLPLWGEYEPKKEAWQNATYLGWDEKEKRKLGIKKDRGPTKTEIILNLLKSGEKDLKTLVRSSGAKPGTVKNIRAEYNKGLLD